jgi:hypothetical protein
MRKHQDQAVLPDLDAAAFRIKIVVSSAKELEIRSMSPECGASASL